MKSRRKFLANLSQAAVSSLLFSDFYSAFGSSKTNPNDSKKNLLVAGFSADPKTGAPVANSRRIDRAHFVICADPSDQTSNRIKVDFPPHSVVKHPTKPWTIIAVPNGMEDKAMEVDLKAGRMTKTIAGFTGKGFYGHGTFTADHSHLLLGEYNEKGETVVTIRDAYSYKLLDLFQSFGNGPHELRILPGEKEMLICHRRSLNIVDIKSGKLVQSYATNLDKQELAHIDVGPDGTIFALSTTPFGVDDKPTINGLVFRTPKQGTMLEPLPSSHGFLGQALSSAIHKESKTLGVTHQDADAVSFWRTDTGEFLGYLDVKDSPHGICLSSDNESFLISNIKGRLFQISIKTRVMAEELMKIGTVGNNAHMLSATFA